MVEALDHGRAAARRRAWVDAFTQLSAADRVAPLGPDDLDVLVTAAYLLGKDDEGAVLLMRSFRESLAADAVPRAARNAFWLAFHLLNQGESARAAGWLARARGLLDDGRHDCVERGYLLFPVAVQRYFEGDYAAAYAVSSQVTEIGQRFADVDLVTLVRHVQGRALIRLGEPDSGLAVLDEAMVAVTAGEVSPIVAGDTYCGVIEACEEIFDLRRAQEWTASLNDWCESQPGTVLYRGQCMVHRSQIMQLRGAWPDAMAEAQRAWERLSQPPGQPAIGAALYQMAELHRLRGDLPRAEDTYRQANQYGRLPQPGLALLRLAQAQVPAAVSAIRSVLDSTTERVLRARLLPAYVEIMLAAGDASAARVAADELSAAAADIGAPVLRGAAAYATAAVLVSEGDGSGALAAARRAQAAWHELGAPYEVARARVLVARASRQSGDEDTAQLELDAARAAFRHLDARPDLALVEALAAAAVTPAEPGGPVDPAGNGGPLTAREVQVLRLVAAGKSNRLIAADLVLSEKTVACHVSNILAKLGVRSRSGATAYAYQHELV
jgi:DNA-binding CsgD family transcriptional regulator